MQTQAIAETFSVLERWSSPSHQRRRQDDSWICDLEECFWCEPTSAQWLRRRLPGKSLSHLSQVA